MMNWVFGSLSYPDVVVLHIINCHDLCVYWHEYVSMVLCIGCYGRRGSFSAYEVVFELVPAWNHKCFCRWTAVYTAQPTSAVGISNEPSTVFNIPGSKYVDLSHLCGSLYSDMHCVPYWMHMCVHIALHEYVRGGFIFRLLPVEL